MCYPVQLDTIFWHLGILSISFAGILSCDNNSQATWLMISREPMGENFWLHLPFESLKKIKSSICYLLVFRALTDSLDKCRRRYQARIRKLEQHCAGQARVQGGLQLVSNNTDTAESRSTRASSRAEEVPWDICPLTWFSSIGGGLWFWLKPTQWYSNKYENETMYKLLIAKTRFK